LLDYRIPSTLDLPARLVTRELEVDGPGAEPVGLGESVIPAVAPAIASAVRVATGAQIRTLPLSPERVLDALEGRPGGAGPVRTVHASPPPRVERPAPAEAFRLVVDGQPITVEAEPLAPLRDVLAETLGIRSVRGPCGVGVCGACTVLVDGRAVRSCLRPIALAADSMVVTVAGLPGDDRVSRAFIAAGAAQCGTCIPGMVLATHDLLATQPAPSDADARLALAGNLCRCGTYGRILEAVAALSDTTGSAARLGNPAATVRKRS
jgi:aerobic-type carbon monoxide dehydrogenase small subunit (CoxS/CutS family)